MRIAAARASQPLAGVGILGQEDLVQTWSRQPLPTAGCEARALGASDKRGLLFDHDGKQLAGSYVIQPDQAWPITVRLEPSGTLIGRLVDETGRPRAGVQLTGNRPYLGEDSRFERGTLPAPIRPDPEGRFRAGGLVPGLRYSLQVWKRRAPVGDAVSDVVVKAGETHDLGEIKMAE